MLSYRLRDLFFILFFVCACAFPSWAEESVIIEEEDEGVSSFADFFDRHVFGSLGGNYAMASSSERYFAALRVGLDYPFEWEDQEFRIYAEGGFATRFLNLDQEIENVSSIDANGDGLDDDTGEAIVEEREIEEEEDAFEVREVYLQYEPLDGVLFSVGRQRPVWGQFDIFSPVNLLLPLEFQSNSPGFSKENYRAPQDMASAVWFPSERVEVSGHYFLKMGLDPLYEDILTSPGEENSVFRNCTTTTCTRVDEARVVDDFDSYDAFAFRALYYGDSFTFGLTYFNGRDSFAFEELPLVERVCASCSGSAYYSAADRAILPEMQALGAEFSYASGGGWSWRAELVWQETQSDLDYVFSSDLPLSGSAAQRGLYDWIVDENEGEGYVDAERLLGAVGFDAVSGNLSYGFSLIFYSTFYGSHADEGRDLAEAAAGDSDDSQSEVLPNLYVFYDFGAEKEHQLGFAGGFLGPVVGGVAFYSGEWQESLTTTISLEATSVISDDFVSDLNDDGDRYELKDDISFGARISFLYAF